MPKKLRDLKVHEVSGVDAAANRRRFLIAKSAGKTKTEDGQVFPSSAYAYVPDPGEPSTWKLRLIESPGAGLTAAQVGRAIAALGPGFRGQKVEIPAADRAKVKAKVLAAWRKTHPGEDDVPAVLKGATMANASLAKIFKGLAGLFGGGAEDDAPGDLADTIADQASDETLEDLCCALSDAIDQVLDADEGDKRTAVVGLLQQFLEALDNEGLLKAAGIAKAGRKISGANMATLNSMKQMLDKMITDASGQEQDGAMDEGDAKKAAKKPKPDGEGGDDEHGEGGGDPEQDDEEGDGKSAQGKPKGKEDNMAKADELVALNKRVDDLSTALEKAQGENKTLAEELAKERGIRTDAEFLAKAKDIGAVPGSSFEQTAALLKSVAGNEELAKQTEATLRASAEMARKSSLFEEVGKNGSQGAPSDAAAAFIAKAQDIAKSQSLSIADAMEKAAKEDPAAYNAYRSGQKKGA